MSVVETDVLIDADALRERVEQLAAEISADYAGKSVVLVCVLKGAVLFLADLMRELTVECEVDFMAVSSYGDATESSGVVRVIKDLARPIAGRHVIVVEDIVDSGRTLSKLLEMLGTRSPASLAVCALLTKPSRREVPLEAAYTGFEIPDRFVVGYGLDFDERFRNLRDIGVVDESRIGR